MQKNFSREGPYMIKMKSKGQKKKQKEWEDLLEEGDRRSNLRKTITVSRVDVLEDKPVFFGYAADLSKSGIFIKTVNPRPIGSSYRIKFLIPDTEISVECEAEVVWIRDYDDKIPFPPGMGLKFLGLDEKVSKDVESYVETINEE